MLSTHIFYESNPNMQILFHSKRTLQLHCLSRCLISSRRKLHTYFRGNPPSTAFSVSVNYNLIMMQSAHG